MSLPHQDNGALTDGFQKLGPMKIIFLIFAGLAKLATLVIVEDARFELEYSRLSWEKSALVLQHRMDQIQYFRE
jgi:hypothetical protein